MVKLDLNDKPALLQAIREGRVDFGERRINWGLVLTVVVAILGWLVAAAGTGAGDYSRVRDRVTTLETQRANDIQRMERIENKIDRLLERR
jgi:hypothetical protein